MQKQIDIVVHLHYQLVMNNSDKLHGNYSKTESWTCRGQWSPRVPEFILFFLKPFFFEMAAGRKI